MNAPGAEPESSHTCLLADIGGTHSRLVVRTPDRAFHHLVALCNRDYPDFPSLLADYLDALPDDAWPRSGMLAVATPLAGDEIVLTNHAWQFSLAGTAARFGFSSLRAVNDFAAVAAAVPALTSADWRPVGEGTPVRGTPVAVMGPGTGLGVALLVPNADDWQAISTEGGHVTLTAVNEEEEQIIAHVRARYGHVSAERLLSGPGLSCLYEAVTDLTGMPRHDGAPEAITARDAEGTDPAAVRTVDLFLDILGTVAGNLVLCTGATGGLYLAGGILPALGERLWRSGFRQRFLAKGRYHDYMNAIPTRLITLEYVGLHGLSRMLEAGPIR